MPERDTKVIGYFAYRSPTEIACDGDACLIAGSRAAMRRYLSISDPKNVDTHTIKKTRFGEIMKGMFTGASTDEIKLMTIKPTW